MDIQRSVKIMKNKRSFKGIWIPKEVWLDENLTIQEKIFYIEINSLDGEKGCYASNEYFSIFFKVGKQRVSEVIRNLVNKGYLSSAYTYKKGTKEIEFRILKTLPPPMEKQGTPSHGKAGDPPMEKAKDNNTVISNKDKRDNKLSPAKKNSADVIPEDTSSEEEFKFGEDPAENKDPISNWIALVTTEARNRSEKENATQPFSIPRNDRAKYIQKIRDYIFEIQNGSFCIGKKFDPVFLEHVEYREAFLKIRGMSDSVILRAIEQSIDNYLTARNNPDKYDFIGRDRKIDLGTFFYEFNENNGVLGVSHFLKYLDADLKEKNDITGKERMLSAIYEKDLSKMYSRVYNQYRDFSDEEMLRMVKSILSLCRWYKRNESKLTTIYKGRLKIRFPKGMETFIEHYLARFIEKNKFEHAISLFPEKKHWKAFADFIYDETDIDLEAEIKTEKKKDSGITITEIKRRMEAD